DPAPQGSCACLPSPTGSLSPSRRGCSRPEAEPDMPYQGGRRLTSTEQASKLGHLEVVNSPFVRSLIDQFEYPPLSDGEFGKEAWQGFDPSGVDPLTVVLAADGSFQAVRSDGYPSRSVAFIKTALVRIDRRQLERIDRDLPHPIL